MPKRPQKATLEAPKEVFFNQNLTFSILTTVSNGITTFETCLSKEREARLNFGKLRSDVEQRAREMEIHRHRTED